MKILNSINGIPTDDLQAWLGLNTTRRVFNEIRRRLHDLQRRGLSSSSVVFESPEKTAMKHANRVGRIDGIKEILSFDIFTKEDE